VKQEELVGFAEVVALLGVAERTAARYVQRSDFPEPLARLAAGPVWRRSDVEFWAAETLPIRRGRPSTE
jgi:predicted DNA-binding transcriptional regulator AlpA